MIVGINYQTVRMHYLNNAGRELILVMNKMAFHLCQTNQNIRH